MFIEWKELGYDYAYGTRLTVSSYAIIMNWMIINDNINLKQLKYRLLHVFMWLANQIIVLRETGQVAQNTKKKLTEGKITFKFWYFNKSSYVNFKVN